MKKILFAGVYFMLSIVNLFGQVDRTVTTTIFEQNGTVLNIKFNLTLIKGYSYNISKVTIYGNNKAIEVITYTGKRSDLSEGETYTLIWDVLKDTDALERPERAEIFLNYTEESKAKLKKDLEAEKTKQKEKEKQEKITLNKSERQERVPLRVSLFGQGGYASFISGISKDHVNMYTNGLSYTYGGGAGLALRVGKFKRSYLQIQGTYTQRVISYYNNNFYSDIGNTSVYFKLSNTDPEITITDLRGYLRMKFGNLAVGGYFSFLQSAQRTDADLSVSASSSSDLGYDGHLYTGKFGYLLYRPDLSSKAQPLKQDYGLSLNFETSEKSRFLLGVGGDLSIPNLINTAFDWNHFGSKDNIDFSPYRSADLRWWTAYLRIGFRI